MMLEKGAAVMVAPFFTKKQGCITAALPKDIYEKSNLTLVDW